MQRCWYCSTDFTGALSIGRFKQKEIYGLEPGRNVSRDFPGNNLKFHKFRRGKNKN